MLPDFLRLFGGLITLMIGAEVMVRGASGLALRWGISPLVVGLTIVAFGTSSPELLVCAMDSWSGTGQLALGTVVGSNICNILLILGVGGLMYPMAVKKSLFRLDLPVFVASALALVACLALGGINRIAGGIFLIATVLYVVLTIRTNRSHPEEVDLEELDLPDPEHLPPLWLLWLFVIAGPVLLTLGADFLVDGARNLARSYNVSEAIIGLTLVALGSSLPELATAIASARKRQGDLVVGNVVGSNIFNILPVLGLSSLIQPITFAGITKIDLGVMLAATLLVVPLMRTRHMLARWESALLLSGYLAYVSWLCVKAGIF